ncbi:MAG: hypothetical protein NT129_05930 [Candidatus Aenigmarchaeota archaeon]|nr:hypothetical protein [Candidatus Aenigmarchaeota archaeon]
MDKKKGLSKKVRDLNSYIAAIEKLSGKDAAVLFSELYKKKDFETYIKKMCEFFSPVFPNEPPDKFNTILSNMYLFNLEAKREAFFKCFIYFYNPVIKKKEDNIKIKIELGRYLKPKRWYILGNIPDSISSIDEVFLHFKNFQNVALDKIIKDLETNFNNKSELFENDMIDILHNMFLGLTVNEKNNSINRCNFFNDLEINKADIQSNLGAYIDKILLFRRFLTFLYSSEIFNNNENNRKKYITSTNHIYNLDLESGLKFAIQTYSIFQDCVGDTFPYNADKIKNKIDPSEIIEKYTDAVKSLIQKTKPDGSKDYKPEGLVARLLDPANSGLIIESFQNPVFLNYVYEGRLPAYSWSSSSGKEMMRALTTGEYEKSYNDERLLIDRVNRHIYSKQPLGK